MVGRTFENSKVRSFTKASIVRMLTSNMGRVKYYFPLEATRQIFVRAVLVCARLHVQVMAVSNSASTSRSDVWKYISKDSSSASATCTLCEKVLAYRGGTSNLRDHLQRSHPREYHHKDKQQSTLDLIVKKCSDARAKVISELLVDLVALDVRPVRFVEGEGFCRLLRFIEPGYRIPSCKHITNLLQTKHLKGKQLLKEKLRREVSALALTTDIWTSSANDAYISLTAHYISPDWVLCSCVLETQVFPEHHTGCNISNKLQSIVKSFDIDSGSVIALVHDQEANIQLCGNLLFEEVGWESINCAAHKLQLCIDEGLKDPTIARAVGAARKLVGHFKHSALATAELKKRQEQMGVKHKKFIQDCPTRWNSVFYMIQRLLEMRWPITAVLSDEEVTQRSDRYLDVRSEQWELLGYLVKHLEPCEIATVFLSYETNVSVSCVHPIVQGLVTSLQADEEDSPTCRRFKVAVASAIRRRWSLDSLDPARIEVLATAFDPRFKQLKFLSDEQSFFEGGNGTTNRSNRFSGNN